MIDTFEFMVVVILSFMVGMTLGESFKKYIGKFIDIFIDGLKKK